MSHHNQSQPSSIPWVIYLTFGRLIEIISVIWVFTLPLFWITYDKKQPRKRRAFCAKTLLGLIGGKLIWEIVLLVLGETKWYIGIISIMFIVNTLWTVFKLWRDDLSN